MEKSNKIIINYCPTGMIPTKGTTPHVPISVEEIIEQTHEAYEVGITIAHLHARNEDESPSYQSRIYSKIFEGLRKHCSDLILCASTSGRDFPEFEKRSEVIELKPDMCSLTLSSLNFVNQASLNSPDMIKRLATKMDEYGVVPELECFDLGMINYGKYLIKKEIIKGPLYWNLIFGNIAGLQPSLDHISLAINSVNESPQGSYIALGGIGDPQLSINSIAIAAGLGVRVGIEDNIWWDKKRNVHNTNINLVKRIHQLIDINQKDFFTPKELGEKGFYNRKK